MMYVINESLIYCPDDGSFWMIGKENEKIIFSPIVSRLMTMLLQGQGRVLTRDELMHGMWVKHGLEPSGNSLNQYISNIRKNLHNFGLDDEVIKTVARTGFIFSEKIKVEKLDRPSNEEKQTHKKNINVEKSNAFNFERVTYLFLAFLSIIIFSTPLIIKNLMSVINEHSLVSIPFFVGEINQCNLMTFKMNSLNSDVRAHQFYQQILDREKIKCLHGETALLFVQGGLFYNSSGRMFVSICNMNEGKFTSCKNHSSNSWG